MGQLFEGRTMDRRLTLGLAAGAMLIGALATCSSNDDTSGTGASGATGHVGGSAGHGGAAGHGATGGQGATGAQGGTGGTAGGGGAAAGLTVSGHQILLDGQPFQIRGVNRSGTEYACIQGWGIFDGPNDAASIAAIGTWGANAVRVPLNETCWLAINGAPAAYSGDAYHQAIADYVNVITGAGLVAIVELHWAAAGGDQATAQVPMPNRDHTPTFWSEVAQAFGSNPLVVFELYNEPYPDDMSDADAAWSCWRDGGSCPGITYQAAGMQELVTAVRATGATNLILLGGVQYSNSLTQWVARKPDDPLDNLAAAWHVYNFNLCSSPACYDQAAAGVLASYPVVTTEIGEDDCAGGFITELMGWLDDHGGSYLAWVWDTWGSCLALVSDYSGTPNGTYGQTYRDHLLSF
jgi:endoglucanase